MGVRMSTHSAPAEQPFDRVRAQDHVMDEVVARASSRDDAFVHALSEHLPRVQRIARLLVAEAAEADDVVADAVAAVLPRWRDGRVEDLPAYLRRAVVNRARRGWRRRLLAGSRDAASAQWTQTAPDVELAAADRDRTLRALRRLPPRRRAVIVLRYYDDLGEADIAATLGISVGTVKSQLSRALEQLRAALVDLDR
jgi:RNA polymerase sigma-70 factor (sigma-E family)